MSQGRKFIFILLLLLSVNVYSINLTGYNYIKEDLSKYNSDITVSTVKEVSNDEIGQIDIKIKKVDENDNYIVNAEMQLLDKDGKVIEEWITNNTYHTVVSSLLVGETYIIHEKNPPEGYYEAEDLSFIVSEDIQEYVMVNPKEIVNIPLVTKVSIFSLNYNEDLLEGVEFELIDKEDNVISKWTSSLEPKQFIGLLKEGETYKIHEIKGPVGYRLLDDYYFTVTNTNDVQYHKLIHKRNNLGVTIIKLDKAGNYLVGSKLQIIDENNNVIEEWISNENSHPIEAALEVGKKYIIHEESAPDNYEKADDIEFFVEGGEDEQKITMINEKKATDITVQIDIKTDNEQVLKGAKLQLKDEDDNVIEEWVSDGNSYMIKQNLIVGKNYIIHEEEIPDGFEQADDIIFTVKDTDEVQSYTMINNKKANEIVVQISQYSDENELLAGSKLQLKDENNNILEEWITDGNVHTISVPLEIGKSYVIHEKEAPMGYTKVDDITFTVEDTDEVQDIKMTDSLKNNLMLPIRTKDNIITKYMFIGIIILTSIILSLIVLKNINKNKIKN